MHGYRPDTHRYAQICTDIDLILTDTSRYIHIWTEYNYMNRYTHMDRYGQIWTDMDIWTDIHIWTDIDTCFKYKQICIDIDGYRHICTDIGLIHTDMSIYWLYMHRYGHIWVDPGLIWEPVDHIDRYNHMNRYTHMNRYERI